MQTFIPATRGHPILGGCSMAHRTVQVVVTLALLMAVVTGPAVASVNLTNIGTAEISGGDSTRFNLIYDSAQSLFWLDYSYTRNQWQNSMAWVAGLTLINIYTPGYTVNVSGTGWRLPTAVSASYPGSVGYNQSGSEMGSLYYTDLGLTAGSGVTGLNATQFPFTTLHADWYWSGTELTNFHNVLDWELDFSSGNQDGGFETNPSYALAVRSGQLVVVPEPSTYFLMAIGLGLVGYARRRIYSR
jgi:PEP-CTERM motif